MEQLILSVSQWESHLTQLGAELGNRQLLVRGMGAPAIDAPLHAEYEDESYHPSKRYRKTSSGASGWTDISIERLLGVAGSRGLTEVFTVSTAVAGAVEIFLPPEAEGQIIPLLVSGFTDGEVLVNIVGGEVGQIVTLSRGEEDPLKVEASPNLRLSAALTMDDPGMLDNLTLQRLDVSRWVELARKEF